MHDVITSTSTVATEAYSRPKVSSKVKKKMFNKTDDFGKKKMTEKETVVFPGYIPTRTSFGTICKVFKSRSTEISYFLVCFFT